MKPLLADLLICPACLPEERNLALHVEEGDAADIVRGLLTCDRCGRTYPIAEGLADLDPNRENRPRSRSKYESPTVLSSYLWSHFATILGEEQASGAYIHWAGLMAPADGLCLDIGAAVGRFAFEMANKCGFVIGLDNSVSFMRTARELMRRRRLRLTLPDEGELILERDLVLPGDWQTANMEFIVADAQALPFSSDRFAAVASLNMVDKVPRPLVHLREANRVAAPRQAQFLLSDPFSWSAEAAAPEDWLGGRRQGLFAGHGLGNIRGLLGQADGPLGPAWTIDGQGQVWWTIRTHSNHYEWIRSRYVKAVR